MSCAENSNTKCESYYTNTHSYDTCTQHSHIAQLYNTPYTDIRDMFHAVFPINLCCISELAKTAESASEAIMYMHCIEV